MILDTALNKCYVGVALYLSVVSGCLALAFYHVYSVLEKVDSSPMNWGLHNPG